MKPINQTPNGQLTYCEGHKHYHLEFGNIFMHLNGEQLGKFTNYVMGIDQDYYLNINQNACNKRKLMLQIGHVGAFFCITPNELFELRELLTMPSHNDIVPNVAVISSELILN